MLEDKERKITLLNRIREIAERLHVCDSPSITVPVPQPCIPLFRYEDELHVCQCQYKIIFY
jgi:hypothetical protein